MRRLVLAGLFCLSACIDLRPDIPVGDKHHIGRIDITTSLYVSALSCGVDFIGPNGRVEVEPLRFGVTETRILIEDQVGSWWIVSRLENITRSEAGPMDQANVEVYLNRMGEAWPDMRKV